MSLHLARLTKALDREGKSVHPPKKPNYTSRRAHAAASDGVGEVRREEGGGEMEGARAAIEEDE